MLNDELLTFVPKQAPISMVLAAGVAAPSNVIDLLGAGVGQPPPSYIGNVTVFGADFGIGGRHPEIDTAVGVAFTTSNAATLTVSLQGAPDLGAGGGYQPGTFTTIVESGPLTAAQLLTQTVIARIPILPTMAPFPRYLRLLFQVPAATNFTAGTISFSVITYVRDDMRFGANNFVALS